MRARFWRRRRNLIAAYALIALVSGGLGIGAGYVGLLVLTNAVGHHR